MTDVYSNIKNGKYENTAKYPIGSFKDPVIAAERKVFYDEQARLDNKFYVDCCEDLGLDPKKGSSEKIFQKAYSDGHSCGHSEVYTHMGDLVYFVNEVVALLQKGD